MHSQCRKILHLDISNCVSLTQKSIFLISKCCSKIQSLNVSNTRCMTNKAWSVICATISATLTRLSVSNNYLINYEIMTSIYPRNILYMDLSRNSSVKLSYLKAIAEDRETMKKPLLTIDVTDCEDLTVDDIEDLQTFQKSNIQYLSNPRLKNYTSDGIRDYITRLIAY